MASQIHKTPPTVWKEKEAIYPNPSLRSVKSTKRAKTPKKMQDVKKSTNELKIEDVFLNSEYFKHQSGNISSLSFCSGDNGENQWTIHSKCDIPQQQKITNGVSVANETIKSDTAVMEHAKSTKNWKQKLNEQNCRPVENPQEKTNKILEGILSGKKRLDRDLITLITEQMFLAERELQITRTHLIETIGKLNERDLEILQLHEKIEKLKSTKKSDGGKKQEETETKTSEDYQRLILASDKLKKQVKDMEDFLNDYGLVWVGDKAANQKPDFDKIVKSFQRLNAVASEPKIIQTSMGAKFEIPHRLPIVLYSNGLLLRNRDFREYEDLSTTSFLKDVEDGYFPSELQAEFPEGVPFEVMDKRNEVYNANSKTPAFHGRGNRLGSTNEGKPSSMVHLEPLKKMKSTYCHSCSGSRDTSEKNLLKRLHKRRSRNIFCQDDRHFINLYFGSSSSLQSVAEAETEYSGRQLRARIRYGGEKMHSFVLQFPESGKMSDFQAALHEKLCEKFHNECLVTDDNTKITDFELHVYGRNPFRLSDRLQWSPVECGIVNNCVINVCEI